MGAEQYGSFPVILSLIAAMNALQRASGVCQRHNSQILISKFFDISSLRMVFAIAIVFTRMFIGFREKQGAGGYLPAG
jgi:hypothetical protein